MTLQMQASFGLALFTWPDGRRTVLFEKGGRCIHVAQLGELKRAVRHVEPGMFDRLCLTCENLGATELEPTTAMLHEMASLASDMKSPSRKLIRAFEGAS